jgi:hypothetical protein
MMEVIVMTLLPEVVTRTEAPGVGVGSGGASVVVVEEESEVDEPDNDPLIDRDESEAEMEDGKDDPGTEDGPTMLLATLKGTDLLGSSQNDAGRQADKCRAYVEDPGGAGTGKAAGQKLVANRDSGVRGNSRSDIWPLNQDRQELQKSVCAAV